MTPDTSVLVAGHGSLRNTSARLPLCATVQALRATGEFLDVRCALWKEEPSLRGALERLRGASLLVIPYFMASGYYTDVVLPRELGLAERADGCASDGRPVRVTAPLGTDSRLTDIILERAREAGFDGSQALGLLGHGTERSPASARTTRDRVDELRQRAVAPEVFPVFIDQEPRVTGIFGQCVAREIILVPYFAADGWHVSETVPADLGLQDGVLLRDGRRLRVTGAVGSSPSMPPLVLSLARAALARG